MDFLTIVVAVLCYAGFGAFAWTFTDADVRLNKVWPELLWWQKMRRMAFWPANTFFAWMKPHSMCTGLDRYKPSYDDLWLFKDRPWLYSLFLWPVTIIAFAALIIAMIISAIVSPFFPE